MQRLAMKATRLPERVNLIFNGGLSLPLLVEDISRLSLSKNQQLSSSEFDLVLHRSLFFQAFNFALRQIAMSPKNEYLLRHKLAVYLTRLIFRRQLTDYSIN